ncbi:MAG: NfeD family protein [Chloroflexota bacterium]
MLEQLIEIMASNLKYSLSQLYSSLAQVEPWLIVIVAIAAAAFIAISIIYGIRAHRHPALLSKDDFIAKTAEVKEVLNPNGTVFIEGELWAAISEGGVVQPGEKVIVTKVDNLKLWVIKQ